MQALSQLSYSPTSWEKWDRAAPKQPADRSKLAGPAWERQDPVDGRQPTFLPDREALPLPPGRGHGLQEGNRGTSRLLSRHLRLRVSPTLGYGLSFHKRLTRLDLVNPPEEPSLRGPDPGLALNHRGPHFMQRSVAQALLP